MSCKNEISLMKLRGLHSEREHDGTSQDAPQHHRAPIFNAYQEDLPSFM